MIKTPMGVVGGLAIPNGTAMGVPGPITATGTCDGGAYYNHDAALQKLQRRLSPRNEFGTTFEGGGLCHVLAGHMGS
jgi:hypothetical protein